ncbi:MAG: alpha/beta hydrolase family protein [Balneolaceae bacterium]|nr:alpha/beta hydrolase family protein [Balneolaceae bacterium]
MKYRSEILRETGRWFAVVLFFTGILLVGSKQCFAQQPPSDIGNFYPFLKEYGAKNSNNLSYLSGQWDDPQDWRTKARSTMEELLAYDPEMAPLNTRILETNHRDGYTQHLIRYNLNAYHQTEAYLLIPDDLENPAPAVIALHDHGGFYYYGKEKHNRIDDQPKILEDYIQNLYDGRSYADELAKRGYVVLSPDAFYFGSQRINPDDITPEHTEEYFRRAKKGLIEKIRAFNELAGDHEVPMEKSMLAMGTTWPGIIVQGDRRAIDLLYSRPEVDTTRIAAMGLSLGGLRTTYLFGMDSRIKAGIIAGFSSTYEEMLRTNFLSHTWMMYVPRQYRYLDLPDVASMNAPKPLMILNAKRDQLFTIEGMKGAEQKLSGIYSTMKSSEKFRANYYDAPHSMTIPMQEDAFEWLDRWLK